MARQKPKPGQIPLFETYPKAETPSDTPDARSAGVTVRIEGTVHYLPPLDIVEDRTPEQLKADGDDTWPNGQPYVPPAVPFPDYEPPDDDPDSFENSGSLDNDETSRFATEYVPPEDRDAIEMLGPHERRMMALQEAAAAGEPAPSIDELYGTAIANVRAVAIADARTPMEIATAETEAAIQQVQDGATEFDRLRCRKGIDGVLHDLVMGMRFTTDDVWRWMERHDIAPPREPRLLGAVMLEYKKDGKIKATGNYQPSVRRHKTPITEWEKRFHNG